MSQSSDDKSPINVIVAALEEAELKCIVDEDSVTVIIPVDSEPEPIVVLVFPDGRNQYVLALAVIASRVDLNSIPAKEWVRLLMDASKVPLAKLEVGANPPHEWIVATAECAFEGVNGRKLGRRLRACATLAAVARLHLRTIAILSP